jgi:hypothetical protein
VEELDRDLSSEDVVGSPPHLRHPTRREQRVEPVASGQDAPRVEASR